MTSPDFGRARALELLAAQQFDVLIIGGGITGAGVARDAAMRRLSVALVEQSDFASGTSSRSSRLVHGGVRYLEHGQLHLVFESSRERRTLLRIAPHLVRPLSFTWPVYKGARVPVWKLGIGLTVYDALALFRNVGRHVRLSARGVLGKEPRLQSSDLMGGAQYWDAATDDVRLTLANVMSAREAGAVVLNHARVSGMSRDDSGRVNGAHVLDATSGAAVEVRARVIVNAAGPWSDRVQELAQGASLAGVRGSKGVHVCVPRSRVGNVAAVTLIAPQDGRVMFVLPAGAFTIIGTTDTFDDVEPWNVRASEADVAYLLTSANHHFPEAQLRRDDVVSAWAGLRPLAATAAGTADPGSVSREHTIDEPQPGLVRVTGGKLTTYRAMAAQVVDVVQRALGSRVSHAQTAEVPLDGGAISGVRSAVDAATRTTSDPVVAERLVHAHGAEWPAVWSLAEADASLRARIVPDRPYILAELRYGVERELACTLGDLLIRRVPLAFETADNGREAARHMGPFVGAWLGWSADKLDLALVDYDREVSAMFSVDR
ncbi:MAG: glycerol-3-phosphate dehydrogenase/oxidase [Gemmatimonadota bacterium]|nr:glycerol-3-phosphate dehydrogenase/oxidase [Gemmatimonadota bacterium]